MNHIPLADCGFVNIGVRTFLPIESVQKFLTFSTSPYNLSGFVKIQFRIFYP
jgi:hypothetical protein